MCGCADEGSKSEIAIPKLALERTENPKSKSTYGSLQIYSIATTLSFAMAKIRSVLELRMAMRPVKVPKEGKMACLSPKAKQGRVKCWRARPERLIPG